VLFPFPAVTPNTDLAGTVTELAGPGGTPIPVGGAVLVARGTAAQRLAEEAPVGTNLAARVIFRPDWSGITQAVGGGPVLVRNRGPVFRALEAFSAGQLVPRNPRTAVGQLADGRVIFVVTDGRRPGYSVGMTNFELAQTLVRLGAVTASALDGGGASTLAFNGGVLNRPSDPGGERAVSTSLQLMYYGVYAAPVVPVISPNGDGIAETQNRLTYKLVRPSTATVTLRAPDGTVAFTEPGLKEPGTYEVAFPPVPTDPNLPPVGSSEGRWQLVVDATDDLARVSQAAQSFTVNNSLGFTRLSRRTLVLRPGGTQSISAGAVLTRDSQVLATVETASGVRVGTVASFRAAAGRVRVTWSGRIRGSLVHGGSYAIRFRASNELGAVELATRSFRVVRAAPVKKKAPRVIDFTKP
jgi:hypothetical protein